MLKQLVHDKINEVFLEYQKANNVTSGDIHPFDAFTLEQIEDSLEALIRKVVAYQPKAIRFDDLAPSWYIYTDAEGTAHSETFGQITEDQFFTKVSRRIAFDDLYDETVQKIYYKGKEVEYVGWQPCMKFEYKDLKGNTIWVGQFEHWDH
jgi:hypothetical protein